MAEPSDPNEPPGFARQLARYGHLGIMFPVSIGIGAWLGYRLDVWLDTLPWFSLGGFLLGVTAAFRDLLRTLAPAPDDSDPGAPDPDEESENHV